LEGEELGTVDDIIIDKVSGRRREARRQPPPFVSQSDPVFA
jgi:hypothetical protein